MNYYNEFDPKAAAWLRELIKEKHIPDGHIDTRSITEVKVADLSSFTQCHFFAGIGGWSKALQLAGVPEDEFVWTGSCPCQPFSAAGKGLGTKDQRHMWPEFLRLIAEYQPTTVFGEQVASPLGRVWLSGVRSDLEKVGYAVGAADLCAAGVGAPHLRQRLYWVANPDLSVSNGHARSGQQQVRVENSGAGRLGDPNLPGLEGREQRISECSYQWPAGTPNKLVWCSDGKARRFEPGSFPLASGVPHRVGLLRGYGNAIVPQVAAEFIKSFYEASL